MSTPAGWYPDPAGDPTLVRYWDGTRWTTETKLMAAPPPPPVATPPAPTPSPPAPEPALAMAPSTMSVSESIAGITTDLLSDGKYAEVGGGVRVMLQNSKMLKVTLGEPVLARRGTMVAFQGSVDFAYEGSGGVTKLMKKAMTSEGIPLMRCSGNGEVFFASNANQIHILHLDGAGLSVNGRNVLAFEPSLQWDIERVKGAGMMTGGLFNTRLEGHGWVAITSCGDPVVLRTDQPTFADPDAAIAWSSNLTTSLNRTATVGAMVGRGSGEAFQLGFSGAGIVIVQPAEGASVAEDGG